MSILMVLLIAAASAQEANTNPVYVETKKCFKSAHAYLERNACYATCKSADASRENAIECSRMRRDFERMLLEEQYLENKDSDQIRGVLALAQLQCKFQNLRSNDEVKFNDCMAENYADRDQELSEESRAQAQK